MLTKEQVLELVVYLAIASIGFSVNVGSRIIYSELGHLQFWPSIVLAYGTGMVVGFVLTKFFAFNARASENTRREMIKFVLVSVVALIVTLITSLLVKRVFSLYFTHNPDFHVFIATEVSKLGYGFINRELAAHLGGTIFGFFINFFGHKFFTFKATGYWEKYVNRAKITV